MQDKIFLDTNIIIYCYSNSEIEKQIICRELFEKYNELNISKQVINEITNILFKKFKLSSSDIKNTIEQISNIVFTCDFDFNTQKKAIELKDRYNLQYYDALILATALENSCNIIFSEDMQHNQVIENKLTIINPFIKEDNPDGYKGE
jgi:predicted nucleic acid-binding protein